MEHDKDRCPICYDRRVKRLRRKGVSPKLVRMLLAMDTPGLPQVRVVESATTEQIAALNSLARRA